MLIADLPPNITRTYNKVQARWDDMAATLRSNPDLWVQEWIKDLPSAHISRKRMQSRIIDAMKLRGLKVTTRTDKECVYIKALAEIEVAK